MEREITNIQDTLKRIEEKVDMINGHVREHGKQIAVLEVTCLKSDAVKIGAMIGAVVLILMVALTIAGQLLIP